MDGLFEHVGGLGPIAGWQPAWGVVLIVRRGLHLALFQLNAHAFATWQSVYRLIRQGFSLPAAPPLQRTWAHLAAVEEHPTAMQQQLDALGQQLAAMQQRLDAQGQAAAAQQQQAAAAQQAMEQRVDALQVEVVALRVRSRNMRLTLPYVLHCCGKPWCKWFGLLTTVLWCRIRSSRWCQHAILFMSDQLLLRCLVAEQEALQIAAEILLEQKPITPRRAGKLQAAVDAIPTSSRTAGVEPIPFGSGVASPETEEQPPESSAAASSRAAAEPPEAPEASPAGSSRAAAGAPTAAAAAAVVAAPAAEPAVAALHGASSGGGSSQAAGRARGFGVGRHTALPAGEHGAAWTARQVQRAAEQQAEQDRATYGNDRWGLVAGWV